MVVPRPLQLIVVSVSPFHALWPLRFRKYEQSLINENAAKSILLLAGLAFATPRSGTDTVFAVFGWPYGVLEFVPETAKASLFLPEPHRFELLVARIITHPILKP